MDNQNEEVQQEKKVQEEVLNVNQTNYNDTYEEKMLDAFVQKPEKLYWYKRAFSKYNWNGFDKMKWNWSWWAFFGGFWFFLYRKSYLAALVVFIVDILVAFIPFVGPLIFAILKGGFGTFFVYKKYKKLKQEIESVETDENSRIMAMNNMGGYNSWVVWLTIAFWAIIGIGVVAAIVIPKLAAQ